MNPYNLAQEDASLSVYLQLEGEPAGKEYAVSQFNMVFTQSMDDKGEPQDFVRGGRMLLTIKELVSENVHLWAIKEQTLVKKLSYAQIQQSFHRRRDLRIFQENPYALQPGPLPNGTVSIYEHFSRSYCTQLQPEQRRFGAHSSPQASRGRTHSQLGQWQL